MIDTGPVSATDRAHNVPREKWWHLMAARRTFCAIRLPSDCRTLIRFIGEIDEFRMWEDEKLKCADRDAFIRKYLGIDPVLAEWAMAGLKELKPNEPVRLSTAVEVGKAASDRIAAAASKTNGEVLAQGRPKTDETNSQIAS